MRCHRLGKTAVLFLLLLAAPTRLAAAGGECVGSDELSAAEAGARAELPGADLLFGEVWGPSTAAGYGKDDTARAATQAAGIAAQIDALGKVKQNKWLGALEPVKDGVRTELIKQAKAAARGDSPPPTARLSAAVAIGALALECEDGDDERAALPFVALTQPPKPGAATQQQIAGGSDEQLGAGRGGPASNPAGPQPPQATACSAKSLGCYSRRACLGAYGQCCCQGYLGGCWKPGTGRLNFARSSRC